MNISDPSDNARLITAMEGKCLEMSNNPVQTTIAGFASFRFAVSLWIQV